MAPKGTPRGSAAVAERPARVARIKVRATKLGWQNNRRRRPGDVFTISGETFAADVVETPKRGTPVVLHRQGDVKEFAATWMELVDADTPEQSMSPSDYARQQQAAALHVPTINPVGHTVNDDDDDEGGATGNRDVI